MKTIRILISSPSDVAEERTKAREVIHRLQRRYIGQLELVPVLWEEMALSVDAPFQEGIESILDRDNGIDIAVFILWSRLGSPLGNRVLRKDGSQYRSGTEREFELMLEAREEAKLRSIEDRPSILAYFRDDDPGFKQSLLEQPKEKIEEHLQQERMTAAFIREHFFDSDDGTNKRAYTSFESPSTFGHRLRMHLQGKLDDYLKDFRLLKEGWDTSEKGAPYRGLEVFDVEHAEIFFGREQETSDIQIALEKQAARGKAFILLLGASGSGKSSLARAGVIPAIQYYDASIVECRYGVFTPGQNADDLFLGLAQTIASSTALPELAQDAQGLADFAETLRESPQSACKLVLRPLFKSLSESRRGAVRLVLLIDQLEELFTHTGISSESVKQFAGAVEALANCGSVWVLATMRSDFYSKLQQYPEWIALKEGDGQYDVLAPRPAHIHRIITEPAWLAGLQFEEDSKTGENLDQRILNDSIKHPEALPLLEFALRELYEIGSDNGILGHHEYEALGGVEGALGKRAEEVWQSLSLEIRENRVPRLFRALCTVDDEQEFTSKALRLDDQQEQNAEFIHSLECFVKARLLISSKSGLDDRVQVKLAHEALIRSWPRLNQWLIDSRDFLLDRARLESALKRWNEENQSHDFLLPEGKPLSDAQALETIWRDELSSEQLDYISRSAEHNENRRKKRLRLYQMASGVLLIFAVLAIIGGIFAWQQRSLAEINALQAKEQETLALERAEQNRIQKEQAQLREAKLAWLPRAQAALSAGEQPLNALYAARALGFRDYGYEQLNHKQKVQFDLEYPKLFDFKKNEALKLQLQACINPQQKTMLPIWFSPKGNGGKSVAFSPNGKILASVSVDKTIKLWDLATGRKIASLVGHSRTIDCVAFSPDGMMLASASNYSTTRLWNLTTSREVANLSGYIDKNYGRPFDFKPDFSSVYALAFSPDGKTLAGASWDKSIRLWDVASHKEILHLAGHLDTVNSVMFSPDGKTLTSASNDSTIKIWDLATGEEVVSLIGHASGVLSVAFDPDGKTLASASRDRTIRLWDVVSGQELAKLVGHTEIVTSVAFSPDGMTLVSASYDRTIKVWNLPTSKEFVSLIGHSKGVNCVALSPDGMTLASASNDGTSKLWSLAKDREIASLTGEAGDGYSFGLAYSPDGKILASSSGDNTIKILDAISNRVIANLTGHAGGIPFLAFSSDGTKLTSVSTDETMKCWDLINHRELASLTMDFDKELNAIAIDPERAVLAIASVDKTIKLWDLVAHKEIMNLSGNEDRVTCLSFSPDGTILACALEGGVIKLWNLVSNNEIASFAVDYVVTAMAFSPDGKTLACGQWDFVLGYAKESDHLIRLWDLVAHKEIAVLAGHLDNVTSFAFSPDGKVLASASVDKTIKLWNLNSREEIVSFAGHKDNIMQVVFSPDGKTLASASDAGAMKLWDVNNLEQSLDLATYISSGQYRFDESTGAVQVDGASDNIFEDNRSEYINLNPASHIGVVRSAINEAAANRKLFYHYIRHRVWNAAVSLLNEPMDEPIPEDVREWVLGKMD